MRHRDWITAGTIFLLLLTGSSQRADAGVQSLSGQQKWSSERPPVAETVFGSEDKYFAVLHCCWRIVLYERQPSLDVVLWDWDKPDTTAQQRDFLVRDVDGDGNEEVAFHVFRLNMCLEENETVLYSPEKRTLYLLKYDGGARLQFSANLMENRKIREWLTNFWLERRAVDFARLIVTYDAQP